MRDLPERRGKASARTVSPSLDDTLRRDRSRRRCWAETTIRFAESPFAPLAVGFFGLVEVNVEGLDGAELERAAELAGRSCPVSTTLRVAGAELAVTARLAAG
jgi:hypothetical protein